MAKKKQPKRPGGGITGTYVYDERTDKIVKVSDRIPSVASRGKGGASEDSPKMPPCGGSCGGGACPYTGD